MCIAEFSRTSFQDVLRKFEPNYIMFTLPTSLEDGASRRAMWPGLGGFPAPHPAYPGFGSLEYG